MVCSGCGAPNRDGDGACAKCGQVFDEGTPRKVTRRQKLLGALTGVGAAAILVAKLLLPSKVEIILLKAEEREARLERERSAPKKPPPPSGVVIRNDEAPDPQPKPVAPSTPEKPAPDEPIPLSPVQVEGQGHLRRAEDLFARGEYPVAAEAYQFAERMGSSTPESRERRKVCADIAYIVRYRDFMKGGILDSAQVISAKENLARINPFTLPNESWREEHRKTLESVIREYKRLFGDEK